ncbi:MAG: hypothetical protein ACI4RD_11130, partial [Kiritimatiellia bacterium]
SPDFGAVHAEISSDIVGYATGSLTKGNYNTMTVQFNSIGKSGFSLNDITLIGMTASDASETADLAMFWDPETSGYNVYYLYSGPEADDGWYNMSTDNFFDDDYPDGMPVGTAFWYFARNSGEGTWQTAGAVENDDTISFTITKGNYNLIASAYPIALKLNDMELSGLTASDASETADLAMFWDPETSGYNVYYLYSGPEADDGWYNMSTDNFFDDDYPNGMPVGTAFWYFARGTGTGRITFAKAK